MDSIVFLFTWLLVLVQAVPHGPHAYRQHQPRSPFGANRNARYALPNATNILTPTSAVTEILGTGTAPVQALGTHPMVPRDPQAVPHGPQLQGRSSFGPNRHARYIIPNVTIATLTIWTGGPLPLVTSSTSSAVVGTLGTGTAPIPALSTYATVPSASVLGLYPPHSRLCPH